MIPAFLALPAEVYLLTYYGQGISTHHLGIIAETSPKEAIDFLGKKVWLMLAGMAGGVACWVASWMAARRMHELNWNDNSRRVTLAALALCAPVWAYGHEFGVAPARLNTAASAASGGAPAAGHTGRQLAH